MNSYLVAYDYGTGGLWAILNAPSRESITGKFPGLQILEQRPDSMSAEEYSRLQARETYDLDGPLPKWLADLAR
ncbi:hypothetical protein [Ferrovibrio sp.]|uniref:hypothetical protein n=1 Tax=Ferrovibrio sp. TaxID=1917215 RepID=UPI00261B5FD8|nr:hypothetical protein [Ferrovibrio sp.]